MAPVAYAQTPDGQTPAEETVCDPLQADGVSKGLYGLCVAFCEAQDWADAGTPITEAELDALIGTPPSGRILANYNKRKQETDPPMPCILVEEPCPCWTAAELATIDGFSPGGTSLTFICQVFPPWPVRQIEESDPPHAAAAVDFTDTANARNNFQACAYTNRQGNPNIFRDLSVQAGTLTAAEATECFAQVTAACVAAGL